MSVIELLHYRQKNLCSIHFTEGVSWTNNLSWVKGYENVLEPMNQLSVLFHQKYDSLYQILHIKSSYIIPSKARTHKGFRGVKITLLC